MSRQSLELCCECGCPTGRAGRGEDSLYIDDEGPFCEDCYKTVLKIREEEAREEALANGQFGVGA